MNEPTTNEDTSATGGFKFRLVHLFYITAVVAAGTATVGESGLIPATLCVVFWGAVFVSNNRFRMFLVMCCIMGLGSCCMFSAISIPRDVSRRHQCSNNLRQIAIALHNYHDSYKTLPPAYFADENGKPIHSWRVMILPYLERQDIFDRYSFDEPWDGPNNSKLHQEFVHAYNCPSTPQNQGVNYFAVVGHRTAWPQDRGRSFGEIVDGLENTVLVLESQGRFQHWMEPKDIAFDQALHWIHQRSPDDAHRYEDFFYEYWTGRHVAMGDGSIHFLGYDSSSIEWAKSLTVSDNRPLDIDRLTNGGISHEMESNRRLKWDNLLRLGIFVFLILLPMPWVRAKKHNYIQQGEDQRIDGYRQGT